jgi:putative alpha-1,2-mannosidase
MRLRLALLASLSILAATPVLAQTSSVPTSAYDAVDPFIGTGGDGHTFPGAVVPFGMVQLSPDTEILPFKQSYARAAGYRFGDPTILGFSHTHFSGAGHSDLGDILLTPVAGEAKLEPGASDKPGSGRADGGPAHGPAPLHLPEG